MLPPLFDSKKSHQGKRGGWGDWFPFPGILWNSLLCTGKSGCKVHTKYTSRKLPVVLERDPDLQTLLIMIGRFSRTGTYSSQDFLSN